MADTMQASSLQRGMRSEAARRRIAAFGKRFGPAHLSFAQHAAFPLALTPDLLYRLWANFQRDVRGEKLKIPWIAVADLLLSPLCDEVDHELYEMNVAIRAELLSALKANPDFGQQRINELSSFLLDYIQQQLYSSDPDIRNFAQVQRWTALAYTQPGKVAHELASALTALDQNDNVEQIRIASLVDTFAEPLAGFAPLLTYARGMGYLARGEVETAREQFRAVEETGQAERFLGVRLPVPERINEGTAEIEVQTPGPPHTITPNIRLREERLKRNWSQAYVAEKIGANSKTVGRWEGGVAYPSPHFHQKLAELFGMSLAELGLVRGSVDKDEKREEVEEHKEVPLDRLRVEREARGWTQEEVAEKIGTTSFTINRWESGIAYPSHHFRQKLADLFGKSWEELGLVRESVEKKAVSPTEEVGLAWEEYITSLPLRAAVLLNPFDISRSATVTMPLGRSDELRMMENTLCNGEHGKALVLYGPPYSGKSSLCKNFLEQHVHRPYWHVYCSLQNATRQEEESILKYIASEICRELYKQLHLVAHAWEDYSDSDPQLRFKRVVRECLTMLAGSRLILALDDFGAVLESYERHSLDVRFFIFWRDLMSEFSQISLIFVLPTSSQRALTSSPLSNAFSFADVLPVDGSDRESAAKLLVDPLREMAIAIQQEAVERAVNLTGGSFYYMNLIGLQLIRQLNQEPQKQVITNEDLDIAIGHIVGANAYNFTFYRSQLQNDYELRILEAIVELTTYTNQSSVSLKKIADSLNMPTSSIRPHLERLRNGYILEEYVPSPASSNRYYSFKIELVRLWLVRNRWFFRS